MKTIDNKGFSRALWSAFYLASAWNMGQTKTTNALTTTTNLGRLPGGRARTTNFQLAHSK